MSTIRWQLDTYTLKINPNNDSIDRSESNSKVINANGTISNVSLFYQNQRSFTIDIYDKPTSYGNSIKSFSNNNYIAIAKSSTLSELYLLNNSNQVDVIDASTGNFIKTISSPVGSTSIAHLNTNIIFQSGNAVIVTDENGSQTSKYTLSDANATSFQSMASDSLNGVYGLNPYGLIYYVNITSGGSSSLVYSFNDYNSNATSSNKAYKGIHYYDGFIGVVYNNQSIIYINTSSFTQCYSIPSVPKNKIAIVASNDSRTFHALTDTNVLIFNPNLSGIDIQILKNKMKLGAILLTDDMNRQRVFSPKSMTVKRLRNMGESRYQVNMAGTII